MFAEIRKRLWRKSAKGNAEIRKRLWRKSAKVIMVFFFDKTFKMAHQIYQITHIPAFLSALL